MQLQLNKEAKSLGNSIVRQELYRCLPLNAPLSIHIFPSFYCNFRCNYCLHSLSTKKLMEKGFQKQYMPFEVFQNAVDNIAQSGWHLKALIFAGHGEPLLHKDIARMVAYAKEKKITDRTEIVTNGSLLTNALSDDLIAAGLDRLRVSLQGVSGEEYRKVSDVNIDFDQFTSQLRYFYTHKTQTEVYIKIIDIALQNPGDQQKFEKVFRDVADTTAIEYAIPFVNEINLDELSGNCKQGNIRASEICSMPFYMLVLYPNGDVLPCCSTEVPIVFGNVLHDNLSEIWKSQKHTEFLLQQLPSP